MGLVHLLHMTPYKRHISVRIFCLLLSALLLQQGNVLSPPTSDVSPVNDVSAINGVCDIPEQSAPGFDITIPPVHDHDPINSEPDEEPRESENTRESELKEDKHLTTASLVITTTLLQKHVITDDDPSLIAFCKVTTPPPKLS